MDCSRAKELLSMYMDGELNTGQKAEFEDHIAKCSSCMEEYEDIVKLLDVLHGIQEEELPGDFAEKLHERLLEVRRDTFTVKKLFDINNIKNLKNIKNFHIKALATVAAGALIVFVLKDIFIDGFISGKRYDNLMQDSYIAESATAAGGTRSARRAVIPGEEQNIIAFTVEGENADEGSSAGTEGEADGKGQDDGEKIMMFGQEMSPGSKKEAESTDAYADACASRFMMQEAWDKNINGYSLLGGNGKIKVTVVISGNVMDKDAIRAIAIDNGAVFVIAGIDLPKPAAIMDVKAIGNETAEEKQETNGTKEELEGTREENTVEFTIQGDRYKYFLDVLEQDAEDIDANVCPNSPVVREDIEARLKELNEKVENISCQIEEIESKRVVSDPGELEKLKEQREGAMEEIRELIESSDYIADVTINVSK